MIVVASHFGLSQYTNLNITPTELTFSGYLHAAANEQRFDTRSLQICHCDRHIESTEDIVQRHLEWFLGVATFNNNDFQA